ncbi:type 1 fimbrial protein [Citrobacter amalonaticus]|nr:type 1 fimbrial protein [Citrobacter amalonaticus]HAU5638873.1 type 1 fimbrial protein [Citrobacter amalonaticus]HDQ2814324.1 type 1 fimbrial protein [Citrobacter amalonaticus]HDZ8013664.1 type 1 fimbrial protein [Citrobacter amalonaticus]
MELRIKTLALCFGLILSSSQAFAADGQVKFTGKILDAACTIDGMTGGVIDVPMGEVAKADLATAGKTADATKFTISLKLCPATISTAGVSFDGTALGGDNTIIALTEGTVEAPAAEQVGIQITDASDVVVPLYTESTPFTLDTAAGAVNNLDFTARYISTGTATAGVADALLNFTVVYN